MMIRFTRFDGLPIAVNPAFVRSVEPYGDTGSTVISFNGQDFVVVQGDYASIADAIDRPPQA
jgi:uncharacterized protein YlzI (FlbEa/FlbD family)